MTRPDPRAQAALSAAFAGAIDLSALKRPPTPTGPGAAAPAGAGPDNAATPYVVAATEATFAEVVQVSTEVLVVAELWSARSAAGAALSQTLVTLAGQGGGAWILARVDVDANPRIAQAFGVQAIPTVVALAGGQPVEAFSGVQPEAQVKAWVASLLDALRDRLPGIREAEAALGEVVESEPAPEPEDPRFTAAEDLLDQGDFEGAKAAYQTILNTEPGNVQAAAALAQADFLARVDTHPVDAVAQAEADPDNVALQNAAADLLLAAGDVEGAFSRLIATVARTFGDDKTAARDHLLNLFKLFPADDELVRTARRKLAAALY